MNIGAIIANNKIILKIINNIAAYIKIKFKPDTLLKLNGKILNNSNMNNEATTKAKGKFLVYCFPVSIISVNDILIIIITNKNNTVIAPTYTIIYDKQRKPIPDKK